MSYALLLVNFLHLFFSNCPFEQIPGYTARFTDSGFIYVSLFVFSQGPISARSMDPSATSSAFTFVFEAALLRLSFGLAPFLSLSLSFGARLCPVVFVVETGRFM